MSDPQEYINSGILEEFVLGLTSEAESQEVVKMALAYPEVQSEIAEISASLEIYAGHKAPPICPTVKPMLMATIDYMERIRKGEWVTFPPELNEKSTPADFAEWLEREDMTLPEDFEGAYAKIIGFTPQATTAITWLSHGSPEEVHDAQYEKFLILEGSCDITIAGDVISLVPGEYLSIPLHKPHDVKVTSAVPCKVILQRIAA
jgi:mannose-6-phosphate isomerase-like protein (cupin superfamily)